MLQLSLLTFSKRQVLHLSGLGDQCLHFLQQSVLYVFFSVQQRLTKRTMLKKIQSPRNQFSNPSHLFSEIKTLWCLQQVTFSAVFQWLSSRPQCSIILQYSSMCRNLSPSWLCSQLLSWQLHSSPLL